MITKEFLQNVESLYTSRFPHSKAFARLRTGLGKALTVDCFLAGDKSENSGNMWDNDILSVKFWIDIPANATLESELPESLTMEILQGSYSIKPENRMKAFDSRKMTWRKSKGSAAKLLQVLDKYFVQLHDSLVNDLAKGNIVNCDHLAVATAKLSGEIR